MVKDQVEEAAIVRDRQVALRVSNKADATSDVLQIINGAVIDRWGVADSPGVTEHTNAATSTTHHGRDGHPEAEVGTTGRQQ